MAEDRDPKLVEIIYLDIISQKKPSYGFSKNYILVQDSDTKQKGSFFANAKEYLTEKVTPFLKNMKTMTKRFKMICCDNAGENNTLEEN